MAQEQPANADKPSKVGSLPNPFGKYEVVRELGRGGMGCVYEARDTKLNRRVALKVPHAHMVTPASLARFEREARLAACLDHHPNICTVHECECIGNIHYLAMMYVEGYNLADLARAGVREENAAEWVRKCALALASVHQHGVIHRDLKPSNIMVNQYDEPIVMDFGLARALNEDVLNKSNGIGVGTPAYMPIEQMERRHGEIGPHSDIYSLGAVLYELLCGQAPFEGPAIQIQAHRLFRDLLPPSTHRVGINEELEKICLTAMAKYPRDRYGSMKEFAQALEKWTRQQKTSAHSKSSDSTQAKAAIPTARVARSPNSQKTKPPATTPPQEKSRQERTGQGESRQERTRQGESRQERTRQGETRQERTRQEETRQERTRQGETSEKVQSPAPTDSYDALVTGGIAGGLLVFVLLGVVIFRVRSTTTVEISLSDPAAKVEIRLDGVPVSLDALPYPVAVKPGEHELVITSPEIEAINKKFTARRGGNVVLDISLVRKVTNSNDVTSYRPPELVTVPPTPSPVLDPPLPKFVPSMKRPTPVVAMNLLGTYAGEMREFSGIKFCWIPAGSFIMGSPKEENNHQNNEGQVQVRLTRGFWMAKYETTQAEYERVTGENPSNFSLSGGGNKYVVGMDTSQFPVERVSWNDAMEYCNKLTAQAYLQRELPRDWKYTLPTEAQWEYACRAGTSTPFHFGTKLNGQEANMNGNHPYDTLQKGPYLQRTTSVGSYRPNSWGLYDMHGNVWEWCQDFYQDRLPGGVNPCVLVGDSVHVSRGGCWNDLGRSCRTADRGSYDPSLRFRDYGFRVVIVPSDPTSTSEEPAAEPVVITPPPPPSTPPAQPTLTVANNLLGTRAGEEREFSGIKFCWIPAGTFTMGSPLDEKERQNNEDQVQVRLTRGFWMAKFETTQAEYQRVMGKNPAHFLASGRGGNQVRGMDTSSFPVETVSWDDAMEYCQKLTEQAHARDELPRDWKYTLPTEAQWEYACRAGTNTPFHFGELLNGNQANMNGNSPFGTAEKGPYLQRTVRVGSYAANGWNLHDMHGNVWEWCQDDYQETLPGGVDPAPAAGGRLRVLRGGSWCNYGRSCRSASRDWLVPANRDFNFGFRAVAVPAK